MATFLKRFRFSTVLVGLVSLAVTNQVTQLSASPVPLTQTLIAQPPDCNNAQTQRDMNLCAGLSYEQADRALNRAYQTLLPNLSATRRQKLTDVQQRWITFRDTECSFVGSAAEGGSMQPLLISSCNDQVTQQRTTDLNAYLSGQNRAGKGSYQTADRRLNQLYQKLRQALDVDRQRRLETAELAWIAFRDSACGFEASGGGKAARKQCLMRLTNQRNQQLQDYLAFDR